MEIIDNSRDLKARLGQIKKGIKTGFVPTMGALHNGHASLIASSVGENDFTTASIFINPAQFTDPADLTRYPRTPDHDYHLLAEKGCDLVFIPSVGEMYPGKIDLLELDFGALATVMEGRFRKGHFQGMATIVYKLFKMIAPNRAYFGEKDFQQLAIIRFMEKKLDLGIDIVGCPTVREPDGLAMSSRNIHLTPEERSAAPGIFNSMVQFTALNHSFTVEEIKDKVVSRIEKNGLFKVEYFEIVNASSLLPVSQWGEATPLRACIAVKASKTRLIDNIPVLFAVRS